VIDVTHECNDGCAGLEFLLFRRLGSWRSNNNLFFLVNAATLFTAFFFQNESVPLRNLCRNIGSDRLVGASETVEITHQLLDQLKTFHSELRRHLFDNDRRPDRDDVLRLSLAATQRSELAHLSPLPAL